MRKRKTEERSFEVQERSSGRAIKRKNLRKKKTDIGRELEVDKMEEEEEEERKGKKRIEREEEERVKDEKCEKAKQLKGLHFNSPYNMYL